MDSLSTTYLLSLGQFSLGGFNAGPFSIIVWIFFVAATFLIITVMMNLLITIIGNKFDELTAVKD